MPETGGQRQVHDLVGDVVVPGGDDHVARLEGYRRQRQHERGRGVLGDGDVPSVGPDEPSKGSVAGFDLLAPLFRGFVPAYFGLELQMLDDRLEDRIRHEPGPGIVEVIDSSGAGRLTPQPIDVECGHDVERPVSSPSRPS